MKTIIIKTVAICIFTFLGNEILNAQKNADSNDEAFIANEYPALIKTYSKGDCIIIEGETHNGIRHNEDAMKTVKKWSVESNLSNE